MNCTIFLFLATENKEFLCGTKKRWRLFGQQAKNHDFTLLILVVVVLSGDLSPLVTYNGRMFEN
jgi:hypothetical protein